MTDTAPLPPHDSAAEQVVIAAAIADPARTLEILRELDDEAFYITAHRDLFRAIRAAYERDRVADMVAVGAAIGRLPRLESGQTTETLIAYAMKLALEEKLGTLFAAGPHLKRLRDMAQARRLARVAQEIVNGAYEYRQTGGELIDRGLTELLRLRQRGGAARGALPASQHLSCFSDWLHELRYSEAEVGGFHWGLPTLDNALGGHDQDDLVLLKAGSGYGKTTLLRQGILTTVRHLRMRGEDRCVAVYLLEGGIHRWYQGALAFLGRVEKRYLRRGGKRLADQTSSPSDSIDARIAQALEELYALGESYLLVSRDCRTAADVVNDVRQKIAEGRRFAAVCIDHLQLLEAPGNSLREKTVTAMKTLLDLRSETDFPIVVISQVTLQENGHARAREAEDVEHGASTILWLDRGPGERNPDLKRKADRGRIVPTKVREDAMPAEVALNMAKSLLDRAAIGELAAGEEPERWWC